MDIPFKEWLKQREQKTGDDDDTKKEKKKSSEVTNGEEEQDEQEEENEENGEAEEKEELQEVDAGNSSVLSRLCSGSFTQLNAQTRRLHRHLYNLKNGLGRREDFVDLFSRKPADGTIKNEFFLDKAIVCEIMRLNVRFIPPSHPPFHVKFFLPTAPKEQAWITIPFGGANFPDLPDDFAIGQHYSMTLQQELLPSDRENLLRAKNHLKPYKFEDLYQRIEPTDIRPNDISTFTSETEDRDYVETIQFMDRGCRRILSRTEVNLDGRLFDIINSSNGNILAMRDDLLFNNFPMIERFQEQRMEGIIEPLPNVRHRFSFKITYF
ncbi:hypothetical protein WR25_07998 [Diploscapter pachys]|uniref:Uncharacterized protein n=1 Tax=Diploscapter pachys TaxID=2018661 RepID=A0A2A2JPV4_9BILA|nr:hypothetical protein WR25_07998 [Diploscapter pachys]